MKRSLRGVPSSHVSFVPIGRRPAYISPRLAIPHHQASRTISRLLKQAGDVQVQQVVFRDRWFTWKKLGTWTLKTTLILTSAAYATNKLFPLEDEEQEEEDEFLNDAGTQSEQEGEEEDDDFIPDETPEGAWFIPLARAQQVPATYWKASDPEWQEFVKFSRDKPRMTRVRAELIEHLRTFTAGYAKVTRILGKDIKESHHWLHLDVPSGPPRAYEQLGIEYAPGYYIAILHRERNYTNVQRARQALWPEAVAMSTFATFKDLLVTQVTKAKKACGFEDETSTTPIIPVHNPVSLQARENETGIKGAEAVNGGSNGTSQAPVIKEKVRANRSVPFLPDIPERDEDIGHGLDLFKRELAKRWKGRPLELTSKAIVMFDGTVEFSNSKGLCTWYVKAWYSVTENKFIHIAPQLRRVRPARQGPRG